MLDWEVLEKIDPYGQRREDLRAALICSTVANALGGKKSTGESWSIGDFQLKFEERETVEPEVQVQKMEEMLKLWAQAANARFGVTN